MFDRFEKKSYICNENVKLNIEGMKRTADFWLLAAILAMAQVLSSCSVEDVPAASATDPLPFPMDAYKDRSVSPGDDFYMYCNGGWIAENPVPEGTSENSIYIDGDAMNRKQYDEMMAEEPLFKRLFSDAAHVLDSKEASRAFLDTWLAKLPTPDNTTTEEYLRLIGRFAKEGVPGMVSLKSDIENSMVIQMWITPSLRVEDSSKTPAPDDGKKALLLIAEGLGIPQSCVLISEKDKGYKRAASLMTLSPEEIYNLIRKSLEGLERFMTDGAEEQAEFEVEANTIYLKNYLFAKRYGSEEVKAKYLDYCKKIQARMSQRIEQLDWMSDATKARARAKIDNLLFMIGYPDKWIEEALVTEEQLNDVGCFLEELFLLGRCDLVRYLTISGKPKRDHVMDYLICYKIYLYDINAYSLVSQNGLFVSLAYLLPPFDLRGDSEAETFASLITVGHEMTHLLDAVGSTYNEHGMREDWWTATDKAAFDERCKLLIDCYSSMEVAPTLMPGVYCDGEKTLSENIADLGGFNVLLDVYTEHLQQQGFRGEDLKAQQRKFFESSADRYRASLSEDGLKVFLDDVHAPYRERVNGMVRNNDLWYELYDVTPDDKLFLPAEKRVKIW